MTCIQCNGQTAPGHTSMTVERDGTTLVVQSAPGEVCTACGEAYLSADTTDRLTALLNAAVDAHVTTAIQQFFEEPIHGEKEPSRSGVGA